MDKKIKQKPSPHFANALIYAAAAVTEFLQFIVTQKTKTLGKSKVKNASNRLPKTLRRNRKKKTRVAKR